MFVLILKGFGTIHHAKCQIMSKDIKRSRKNEDKTLLKISNWATNLLWIMQQKLLFCVLKKETHYKRQIFFSEDLYLIL